MAVRKYVEVNEEECSHCGKCLLVCSVRHEGIYSPELARIKINVDYAEGQASVTHCLHCAPPVPCEEACEIGAISRNSETGAMVVSLDCVGCRKCIWQCPYPGAIWRHPNKGIAIICDLCDGDPECIKYCPREALTLKEETYEEVA